MKKNKILFMDNQSGAAKFLAPLLDKFDNEYETIFIHNDSRYLNQKNSYTKSFQNQLI